MTEPRPLEQPPLSEEAQAEARAAIAETAELAAAGVLFAVVNSDGTLARGSGAVSATMLFADGQYQVLFNQSINRGAFLATIGLSADSGEELPGEIVVNLRVGTTNGVYVQTFNSVGEAQPSARSFHLAVVLP
jgi:hypothetical protein